MIVKGICVRRGKGNAYRITNATLPANTESPSDALCNLTVSSCLFVSAGRSSTTKNTGPYMSHVNVTVSAQSVSDNDTQL